MDARAQIKPRVLKHTIFLQVLQIEAAQGANNADKIEDRQVSPSA